MPFIWDTLEIFWLTIKCATFSDLSNVSAISLPRTIHNDMIVIPEPEFRVDDIFGTGSLQAPEILAIWTVFIFNKLLVNLVNNKSHFNVEVCSSSGFDILPVSLEPVDQSLQFLFWQRASPVFWVPISFWNLGSSWPSVLIWMCHCLVLCDTNQFPDFLTLLGWVQFSCFHILLLAFSFLTLLFDAVYHPNIANSRLTMSSLRMLSLLLCYTAVRISNL